MFRIALCDDCEEDLAYYKEEIYWIAKDLLPEFEILTYPTPESLLFAVEDVKDLIDTMFLDIRMPGTDGISLVEKLRAAGYRNDIVFLTCSEEDMPGYEVAKEQLLRPLDEATDRIAKGRMIELEKRVLREANTLGIGPMGLGGKTTLLGVKIASRPRVPASFFVTIAYMCWACRRRTVCVE